MVSFWDSFHSSVSMTMYVSRHEDVSVAYQLFESNQRWVDGHHRRYWIRRVFLQFQQQLWYQQLIFDTHQHHWNVGSVHWIIRCANRQRFFSSLLAEIDRLAWLLQFPKKQHLQVRHRGYPAYLHIGVWAFGKYGGHCCPLQTLHERILFITFDRYVY